MGSNLIALASALLFQWNVFEIVLTYWAQSFFIGVYQRRKIVDIFANKRRETGKEWVLVSGTPVYAKDGDAGFSVCYGIFWAVAGAILYFSFSKAEYLTINWLSVSVQSGIFFVAHWWSYRSNKKNDEQRDLDPMANVGLPLLRMFLPLHLVSFVIDFGSSYSPSVIVVWMLLKTVVDVGTHVIEHDKNRVTPL